MFPSLEILGKLSGNYPSSFPSEVGEGKGNSPFPGKFPVPREFHCWQIYMYLVRVHLQMLYVTSFTKYSPRWVKISSIHVLSQHWGIGALKRDHEKDLLVGVTCCVSLLTEFPGKPGNGEYQGKQPGEQKLPRRPGENDVPQGIPGEKETKLLHVIFNVICNN